MNIFQELLEAYTEIESRYANEQFIARTRGWNKKEGRIARRRKLNDHAYFLFMFSRLEDQIREASSRLIQMRQRSIGYWKRRRAWDLLPAERDSDRIAFRDRVALLIDRETHTFRDLMDYYRMRNLVVHGGIFTAPVSIPTVVRDFEVFSRIIRQ